MFIIYFKVRASNKKLFVFFCRFNKTKNMSNSFRYYTPLRFIKSLTFQSGCGTHHCMGFSTASLTVSKYCSIITFYNWFYQRKTAFIINLLLSGFFSINLIKCESSRYCIVARFKKINLLVLTVALNYSCRTYLLN